MTATIYINKEPLFCFVIDNDFMNYLENYNKPQIIINNIVFLVLKIKNNNIFCKTLENINKKYEKIYIGFNWSMYNFDKFDICNNPSYPKMADNVKPIWVGNDCGKQITFLIDEEKTKMCANCFCISISSDEICQFCGGNVFYDEDFYDEDDEDFDDEE